jgi:HEAT repeat protein
VRPILALLATLAAACSSGPSLAEQKEYFYYQLQIGIGQYESALDSFNRDAQAREEYKLGDLTRSKYPWLFEDAVKEPDYQRRKLAVWGLAFCPHPKAHEILKAALADPHPDVRAGAAVGIGRKRPSDPPYDTIFVMLEDRDPYVVQAALFALKEILRPGDDRGKLDRIVSKLDDPEERIRNEAAHVLGQLRMASCIDPLVKKGLGDPSLMVRVHSAMALGRLGTDGLKALPYLIERLKDPETKVVEAAWFALRKITGLDLDRSYHSWRDWYEEDQKRFEYVCPEHSKTVIRETAGTCPECGRQLVKQPRPIRPRQEDYVCPEHPEVTGGAGGKCAKCKADLVPKK